MSRYTTAYSAFTERLDEVKLLQSKAAQLNRSKLSGHHGPEINALCRGSVVLLSSHIEAYLKELGEKTLDSIYDLKVCRSKISPLFFYHMSKARIENIRSGSDPEGISRNTLTFVNTDAEMWNNTGTFPCRINSIEFNKGFSNPKFEKIRSYFGRFGYIDFQRDLKRELQRSANTAINNLDNIVNTRNSIAHGDPSATKTPNEVKDMMNDAKIFCRTTDVIFSKWCKINLCNIKSQK